MTDILEAFREQVKANPEILKSTLLHGSRGGSYQAFPASIKTEQRASNQIAGSQVLSCSSSSPTPPTTWLSGYDLDPRPDLIGDHRLWQAVLAEAWMMDERAGEKATEKAARQTAPGKGSLPKAFYGLLHGLRCGGARLQKHRLRNGKEFLKLDYQPLIGPGSWNEEKLIKDWLEPHKGQMKECFERALAAYEMWEEMRAERAADKMAEGKTSKSSRNSEGKTEEQVRPDLQTSSGPSQASLFRPA